MSFETTAPIAGPVYHYRYRFELVLRTDGEFVPAACLSKDDLRETQRLGLLWASSPGGEALFYYADVLTMFEEREKFERRKMVKAIRGMQGLARAVVDHYKKSTAWTWIANVLTILVVAFYVFLVAKRISIPVEFAQDVVEAVGILVVFIGSVHIGVGVDLSREEKDLLKKFRQSSDTSLEAATPIISSLLIKASDKFNHGMIIVAEGTFCLLVKVLLAANHIGQPATVPCTPVEQKEQYGQLMPKEHKRFLCAFSESS